MENQLIIRQAEPEDFQALWATFQVITAAGDSFAYTEEATEDTFRNYWFSEKTATYVLEVAGVIAGGYTLRPNHPGRGRHIANASYMVDAAYRGKGYARLLCEHSIAVATSLGYRGMQFNLVVATNAAAVHTWQACGFECMTRLPGAFHHKELGYVDAWVMFRSLV